MEHYKERGHPKGPVDLGEAAAEWPFVERVNTLLDNSLA